ncbi:MAG: hypothetical protein LQ347_004133 [Umbilicaria vellea]|nr:MAG: hypothetical protein LQ347_004133 [Umbilicaria vellea]
MSTLEFQSRGAYPQPKAEDGVRAPPGEVVVYLPGYENDRVLLRFWAYSVDEVHGPYVTYQFAYDMCMAMTDNARPGFFTKERAPNSEKIKAKRGGLLAKEKCFFQTGSDTSTIAEKYPVLRSFRDLNFRPEVVDAHWREAVPWEGHSEGYKPDACILSGEDVMIEDAHLIPKTEWQFWKENALHRYAMEPAPRTQGRETYTRSNTIPLASNLHKMYDAGHFVLIPVDGRLQAQWIRRSDHMALKYHHRRVQGGLSVVSPELAYLACVYRMIGVMQEELLERGSQETLVMTREGGAVTMNGFELGQYKSQQLRNTSPTKSESGGSRSRKRDRGLEDAEQESTASEVIDHDDVDEEWSDSGTDVREYMRGRPRTQLHEEMTRSDARRKRQALRRVSTSKMIFSGARTAKESVRTQHEELRKKRQKHN